MIWILEVWPTKSNDANAPCKVKPNEVVSKLKHVQVWHHYQNKCILLFQFQFNQKIADAELQASSGFWLLWQLASKAKHLEDVLVFVILPKQNTFYAKNNKLLHSWSHLWSKNYFLILWTFQFCLCQIHMLQKGVSTMIYKLFGLNPD